MKTYADTSLLFSLYVTDANSPKADAWRQTNPDPLDFTSLRLRMVPSGEVRTSTSAVGLPAGDSV